ncbi:MAG TPA: PQQ-dependent sugar dehydrogenase [Jatrophihabitantaceae bacterium]|nr:PQQ-dependent sugar dehydrogenase [Jatrophihabitantaceae bacterium]
MPRIRPLATAALLPLLLAGCGAGANADAPTWVPKPSFSGEGRQAPVSPAQPQPTRPPGSGGNATPSPSSSSEQDPFVVATKLVTPDAIAVLPDNTALVGERTTGRIVLVQPEAGKPVRTVRTLPGVDGAGDGGLLDLALSPNFLQDRLVFAYLTTATDNRVVAFTLSGPVTPVLTGIPRGTTGNGGRIAFGADERLYVATGDAGSPQLAADRTSLAGKVLRVTDVGRPASGNPLGNSPVYTLGHHSVVGLCPVLDDNQLLEVESAGTEINQLQSGDDYGWPTTALSSQGPISTLPSGMTAPGGCAVIDNLLFVTSRDGQALLSAELTEKGAAISVGKFRPSLQRKYGRLLTIVPAADGALWITTSNRDGHGKPARTDERVLRIIPATASGNSPA